MRISHAKLIAVFNKVRIIREHLDHHAPTPTGPVLSIMDLHWAIEDVYALQIEMVEVQFNATYLKGKVERYVGNRARVLVRSNLNKADKRHVAVKELCHVVIDEEDDWSVFGVQTLDGLLTESVMVMETGEGLPDPAVPLQSEMLAQFAAAELLYPRFYHEGDRKRLEAGETTIAGIALQHDVPAYVVEHSFRHREMLDRVWAKIEAAEAASRAA